MMQNKGDHFDNCYKLEIMIIRVTYLLYIFGRGSLLQNVISLVRVAVVSPRSLLLSKQQRTEIYFHLGTIAPRRYCNKFSHNSVDLARPQTY